MDLNPTYEELEKRVAKLENALQESEQKFTTLFEKGPVGIAYHQMVYDESGKPVDYLYLEANQNFQKLTGANPVGMLVTEVFPGIDKDPFDWIGKFGDVAKKGSGFRVQQHFPVNDRWYDVVGYQYKPDHFVAAFIEITEHMKAEKELYTSERRFKELIRNSSDSIVILDKDGLQIYVSDAVEKHLGYKPSEVINISVMEELIHPEDQESTMAAFHKMIHEGQGSAQYRHKHKNGSWVHLEAWGTNQLENPDIQGVVVNVRNITEWKLAEEALKRSEYLFKLITRNTSALVSIHDSLGNYIFANPSHEQLGYKPKDLIGESGFAMMVQEDIEKFIEFLEKAKNGEISKVLFNYRLKDKQERIHYYRGALDAVFNADGSFEKIICVGEDITELQEIQVEKMAALTLAAEASKLALVGQIAGKMAHDFNNILGAIMGNTELALIDCTHNEIRKKLELIFNQTIRGKNLTKNLIAFAKDQEPKQEFFSIEDKLELIINLMKKDLEGIHIMREYSYGLPELLADPGMVEHAIVNLVQNSVHATSLIELPRIIFRTYHKDEHISIEIEDNGCGIPNEFLTNIFDPSFTLKGSKDNRKMYEQGIRGTGYGMSNVKKYIEQHKGDISIDSKLQEGTKVTIRLPVIKKELSKEEIIKVKNEKIFFGKYILLVEDEQSISDVQYKILTNEPCNHMVDIAGNGQIAIDLLNRNEYDLISLDYVLPGKFDGMDVYRQIRGKNKTVPVLFISGNIEFLESIKDLKLKDSHIDHLSKPCKNIDYVNYINRLFGRILKK